MRKYLFIVLIIFIFGSCLTDRKIARNCDRFVKICGHTQKTTAYKDTTITIDQDVTVPIAPDPINYSGLVSVINGKAELPEISLKGNLIAADLSIQAGIISYKAYLYKSELPVRLYATITLPGAIRETSEITTVHESVIPKIYKIAFWIVITEIVITILWLASKFNLLSLVKKLLKPI